MAHPPDPRQASTAQGSGPAGGIHGDHGAGGDVGLFLDGGFNVLGINVDTRRGDDHLALAPKKAQLAGLLAFREVAGGEPAVLARTQFAVFPGGAGDDRAAHENFAVGSELDLAPGERLADGTFCDVKGMIERDDRGGLGHAVTLDEHESERVPELLQRARQSAAAGDECPELQAELAMHGAESPPAQPRIGGPHARACARQDRRLQLQDGF